MNVKKNDETEVYIEDYSSDGSGIAKPDGFVLFIPGTLKGERVLAHITKLNKSYGFAKAMNIIEPSPQRRVPECRCSSACGGCELWHMSYAEELAFKRDKVRAAMLNAGIAFEPSEVLHGNRLTGYRNKAQYPIREQDGKIRGGFYRRGSHTVIEGKCIIQPDIFDEILNSVSEFMANGGIRAYDEVTRRGTVRHLYLRASEDKKSVMVCVVVAEPLPDKSALTAWLTSRFPEVTTVIVNYNSRNTNVITGEKYEVLYGDGYITDSLCGKKFVISPQAFYQVNHEGCEILYDTVKKGIGKADLLLDLYCGIGTIGICTGADTLYGVEAVKEAVWNAKLNARLNGIENAQFYTSDAENAGRLFSKRFDAIIVDPPRHGCDEKTIAFLIKQRPSRLVYVSCDCATLARDLKILLSEGFELVSLTPVDMFPRTKHIETVAVLISVTV